MLVPSKKVYSVVFTLSTIIIVTNYVSTFTVIIILITDNPQRDNFFIADSNQDFHSHFFHLNKKFGFKRPTRAIARILFRAVRYSSAA